MEGLAIRASQIGKKMFTLAWDIDDVLNDLMRTWFEEWWRPRHPECMLDCEDIKKNPPDQLLGIALDEYLQSLDDFRLSGRYEQMQPHSEVLEWFKKHGSLFRHIAVTSVPREAAPVSAAWVISHFGDWIRTFHFVPSPRVGDISTTYESTKAGYLKWLNRVDIFIDDNEKNVHEARSLGTRCFLVSQPWNSGGIKIEEILESLNLECKTRSNHQG